MHRRQQKWPERLHPVCQEKLFNPGLCVSINPNQNSILTHQCPIPDVRLGHTPTRHLSWARWSALSRRMCPPHHPPSSHEATRACLRAPRVSEDTRSGLPNPAVSGPPRSILRLASSSNARLQSREYDRRRTRTSAQHGGPGARGPVRGGSQVAFGIAAENTSAQDHDQGRAGGLRSQAIASAARGEGR